MKEIEKLKKEVAELELMVQTSQPLNAVNVLRIAKSALEIFEEKEEADARVQRLLVNLFKK